MMDNRVGAIKDILHQNGFGGKVRMKLKGSSLGKGLSAFVRVLQHCLSQTGKDPFTVTIIISIPNKIEDYESIIRERRTNKFPREYRKNNIVGNKGR